jgi:CHAT domain-containing protein/tetratricopeptide (TPR) repeat protein
MTERALSGTTAAALLAIGKVRSPEKPGQLRDLLENALLQLPSEEEELGVEVAPQEIISLRDLITLHLADEIMQSAKGPRDASDARRLYKRLDQLRSSAPTTWARVQHNLGTAELRCQTPERPLRLQRAATAFRSALEVWRPENDPENWLGATIALSEVLRDTLPGNSAAHLNEAGQVLRKAVGIVGDTVNAELRAKLLSSLGATLRVLASKKDPTGLDEAIDYLRQASALLADGSVVKPSVENNLGLALAERAELSGHGWVEARQHLEYALRATDRASDPLLWGRIATNLAPILRHSPDAKGLDIPRSIELLKEAIQAFAAAGDWWAWAGCQNNLGNALLELPVADEMAAVDEAASAYEAALTVWTRDALPLEWALTTARLARTHERRASWQGYGALQKAYASYTAALDAIDKNRNPIDWARIANSRAGVLLDVAEYEPAPADKLRAAIADYEAAANVVGHDRSPLNWAQFRHNAGNAHRQLGELVGDPEEFVASARAYEEALDARPREVNPVQWAQTTGAFARTLAQAGRTDEALPCFEAALKVAQEADRPSDVQSIARELGSTLAYLGQWNEAAKIFDAALGAAEELYAASVLRRSREFVLAQLAPAAMSAAYAHARAGDAAQAAATVERARARLLGEALALNADVEQLLRHNPEQRAAYLAAADELYQADLAAANLMVEAEHLGPDAESARRRAEDAIRQRRRAARAALERASQHLTRNFTAENTGIEPDRPVAYLMLSSLGGLALIWTATNVRAVWAPHLRAAELEALLAAGSIRGAGPLDRQAQPDATWGPQEQVALDAMLDMVLPPIGEALCGRLAAALRAMHAQAVALVPCGRLGLLPLHAAPYEFAGRPRCLVDEFVVSYAPSLAVLRVATAAAARRARAPVRLAAVVDPRGDLAAGKIELADTLTRLGKASITLAGAAAQRSRVLSAIRNASHVHFASHARTMADRPLESHIMLAGYERLSLLDLLTLGANASRNGPSPLARARLVVASACQTAVSGGAAIPDEVVGLPAGFLQVGVPAFIGTLWPIADLPSALLMTRFYELLFPAANRRGLATDAALREAAIWLRDLDGAGLKEFLTRHEALAAVSSAARKRAEESPHSRPYAAYSCWAAHVHVGASTMLDHRGLA